MKSEAEKEAIRLEIMKAFERLAKDKPLTAVSLREIAVEAGMTHTKILRYFDNKNSLLVSCVHWAATFIINSIEKWFAQNNCSDYANKEEFLDAFFTAIQTERQEGVEPRDVVMTCALGAYSPEIKAAVKEEYARVDKMLSACLSAAFGEAVSEEEITTLSVIFFGIYFLKFNDGIPNGLVCHPMSSMNKLINGDSHIHLTKG